MSIKIISESTTEPILLAEAALNLNVDPDDSNSPPGYVQGSRILRLITAARQTCEEELEIALVTKTVELALDAFPLSEIELPLGPVRSITSVKYLDSDDNWQTISANDYVLDDYQRSGWLLPAVGTSWPSTKAVINSVKIRYVAGYPSADSPAQEVPEPIRQAMHLFIAHYFANREAVDTGRLQDLPLGVRYLLGKYRRNMGV
jgi:uncharacterized phiE125 gp8 family phage protein